MRIVIADEVKKDYQEPLADWLANLASAVPEADLKNLDCVRIVKNFDRRMYCGWHAMYIHGTQGRWAEILISAEQCIGKMSNLVRRLPFLAEMRVARAFLHELGHHHQAIYSHGVSKEQGERYAEEYALKYFRKIYRLRKWKFILCYSWVIIPYGVSKLWKRTVLEIRKFVAAETGSNGGS